MDRADDVGRSAPRFKSDHAAGGSTLHRHFIWSWAIAADSSCMGDLPFCDALLMMTSRHDISNQVP